MKSKKSEVRYKRILALGKDRVGALNTALAAGTSTIKLAQKIQWEWKALTNVKTATLAKQLTRYRAEMIPELVVAVVPGTGALVEYTQPPTFDFLDELEKLVTTQWERLQLGIAKERQLGYTMASVSREVMAMLNLLIQLAKLQFELGVLEYKGPSEWWYR